MAVSRWLGYRYAWPISTNARRQNDDNGTHRGRVGVVVGPFIAGCRPRRRRWCPSPKTRSAGGGHHTTVLAPAGDIKRRPTNAVCTGIGRAEMLKEINVVVAAGRPLGTENDVARPVMPWEEGLARAADRAPPLGLCCMIPAPSQNKPGGPPSPRWQRGDRCA